MLLGGSIPQVLTTTNVLSGQGCKVLWKKVEAKGRQEQHRRNLVIVGDGHSGFAMYKRDKLGRLNGSAKPVATHRSIRALKKRAGLFEDRSKG